MKKQQKEVKLANQIGKVATISLVIVFTILIAVTVILTSTSLTGAIDDSISTNANNTANQILNVIESAESTAEDIGAYLQKAYEMSAKGYSNMAGEIISEENKRQYKSIVYGTEITELSADVEKYITETARNTAQSNDNIVGIGAMFEPYKYDTAIKDYSFYVDENIGTNDKIQSFNDYSVYSQESYYKDALQSKKTVFTDPYEYNGILMITYAVPILLNGEVQGVVMADIKVDNFAKTITKNEKYTSMYTAIFNHRYIDIYDSETQDDIGTVMDEFYKNKKELEAVKQNMSKGQAFFIETVREDGRIIARYFSPISAAGETWWSMTALDKTEKDKTLVLTIVIMVVVSVISLVTIVCVLITLLKKKIKPIESVVHAAERIAGGDLNVEINVQSMDEIGKLAGAFQTTIEMFQTIIGDVNYLLGEMADGNFDIKTKAEESYKGDFRNILMSMRKLNRTLSETLLQIVESSNQVALGSTQMAESAQSLAEGASEQAGAVEELTATIENVSSMAEESAEKADNAYKKAKEFEQEAEDSSKEMEHLTAAMMSIRDTSKEIERIITDIEDIASQTNLLSLNASIEAARAGEAGRGFAVVADQIGKLASDSAHSAVNTRELIGKSIQEISNGNAITESTSKALGNVIEGIKLLADSSKETSEISNVQAETIKQIEQGIEQISMVVQSNSAAAQETSATSEELSAQSESLNELVDHFKLRK